MKKYLILFFTIFLSSYSISINSTELTDDFKKSPENVAPSFHNVPKEEETFALNYVNQPPMIPHSVKGYQITKNTNQCLDCHGVENYRTAMAPRISPTHFTDRNGNLMANTSPRRYFCLQCHVPQTAVEPIIENQFQPIKGFGEK